MTPEQQRTAIAEACGWYCNTRNMWFRPPSSNMKEEPLPDYLNDLNAMHEAEKVLTKTQQDKYYTKLSYTGTWFECLHSTASQRAEAFLRTIGKWKD